MSGVSETLHNASKKATPVGLIAGALTAIGAGALLGSGVLVAATAGLAAAKVMQLVVRDGFSILALKQLPKGQAAVLAQNILKVSPRSASYVPQRLLSKTGFLEKTLTLTPNILSAASPACRGNPEFMKNAAKKNPSALQYATDALKKNRAFMKEMVAIDIRNLPYAHPTLLNDTTFIDEIMMSEEAVASVLANVTNLESNKSDTATLQQFRNEQLNPIRLQFKTILDCAGDDVLRDLKLMPRIATVLPKEAYKQASSILQIISEFMLPILQQDISLLKAADDKLLQEDETMATLAQTHPEEVANILHKRDIPISEEVMVPLAMHTPSLLEDPIAGSAAETVARNPKYMQEICSKNSQALEYATDAVFDSIPAMTAIAEHHPQATYAALMENGSDQAKDALRKERTFMTHVINGLPSKDKEAFLRALPKALLESIEANVTLMQHLIEKDPTVLGILKQVAPLLHGRLCRSLPAMLAIAKHHPSAAMQAASPTVQKNESFIRRTIAIDPSLFRECAPKLSRDFVFMATCLHCNPEVFQYLDSRDSSDQDTILSLLEAASPAFFEHVDASLKGNKTFMKKVVAIHGDLFRYAPEALRRDPEYVKSVLKSLSLEATKALFPHIPEDLRKNEAFLRSIKNITHARDAFMHDPVCYAIIRKAGFFSKLDFLPNFDCFQALLQKSEEKAIIEMVLEHEDYLSALDISGKNLRENELLATLIAQKPSLIKKIPEPSADLVEMIALENCEVMQELCNDSPVDDTHSPEAYRQTLYRDLMGDIEFIKRVAEKQPQILKFVNESLVKQHHAAIAEILLAHQSLKHQLPNHFSLETLLATLGSQAHDHAVPSDLISGAILHTMQLYVGLAQDKLDQDRAAAQGAQAAKDAAAQAMNAAPGDMALIDAHSAANLELTAANKRQAAAQAKFDALTAIYQATHAAAPVPAVAAAPVPVAAAAAVAAPVVAAATARELLLVAQNAVFGLPNLEITRAVAQDMVDEAMQAADRTISAHQKLAIKQHAPLFRALAAESGNGVYKYAHDSIRRREHPGLRGVFQGGYIAR